MANSTISTEAGDGHIWSIECYSVYDKEAMLTGKSFITWGKDANELGKYQQIDAENKGNIANI